MEFPKGAEAAPMRYDPLPLIGRPCVCTDADVDADLVGGPGEL